MNSITTPRVTAKRLNANWRNVFQTAKDAQIRRLMWQREELRKDNALLLSTIAKNGITNFYLP
ncbi:hypothetical protein [Dyadobacter psychrotolerans]|uniref:Uncharacterized protein n=1 Tax=Dyadobacter psychrotolerans TaxID=2541721 RepID=A0A4R5DT64_9BACT|nr:hypothetical protein [Dyadobacter psychrotolerans]TDE15281.1 hypothetical protein E0F88_12215 [Dyadobacter psychrotolerans]